MLQTITLFNIKQIDPIEDFYWHVVNTSYHRYNRAPKFHGQ